MCERQFEKFLAKQFLEWSKNEVQAGFRYQFKSPNPKNGEHLHSAIIDNKQGSIEIKNTIVPYVICGDIKLLIVLHGDSDSVGYTENFISLIRDLVAGQQGELLNAAMLIIHNSLLDTIVNSAEDLAQKGAIWNPSHIKVALKSLIDENDNCRNISEGLLNYQFNAIIEDDATMFGFKALFDAVSDGEIEFNELDMFDDPLLFEMDNKPEQIKRRLDENRQLFTQIAHVVENYPEDLSSNLPHLGEKFVKTHFKNDASEAWKKVSFREYRLEQDKNRTQCLLLESETSVQGELISRAKSESMPGQRNRHHILVLDDGVDVFDIELSFIGGVIESKEVIIKAEKEVAELLDFNLMRGSKRSKVTIQGKADNDPLYFRVDINRNVTSEKFQFHCLIVRDKMFHIEALRNCFLINDKKQFVILQTEDNSLVVNPGLSNKVALTDVGQVLETSVVGELDFEKIANEADEIKFTLKSGVENLDFYIEGAVSNDSLSLPLLLDKTRYINLFNDSYFGVFHKSKNKIQIDNKEISPKARRLSLLQHELYLFENFVLFDKNGGEESISIEDIRGCNESLSCAYKSLFDYIVSRRTLISLVSWGDDFSQLVKNVIEAYEKALIAIPINELLSDQDKVLLKIGFFEQGDDRWITPFHPVVLSYYLYLTQKMKLDEKASFVKLPNVTISRLNAQGLIPFLYHPKYGFTYTVVESDNSFWLRLIPQKNSSYSFVRKLVKDKVTEFRDSFSVLFEGNSNSPLIINSINNGYNEDLFLGLVDYIRVYKGDIPSIHVNLFDDKIKFSEFDLFSESSSYDEIKSKYGLDKGKARENSDAIIDKLRTKLTYSKFRNSESTQTYAHLSFFRNNEKVSVMDVNIEEEESGVVCHGLICGEASYSKQQSYVTGFGLKDINYTDNNHLKIAKLFSTLLQPAKRNNNPYRESSAISLAVSDSFKTLLEKSYDSSIWTTIIDPKVTLDFFKSNKDVVLIHYSDQYTNSSSYDAITVSRQTELYHKVLEKDGSGSISELNAFNGEWLLKMITSDPRLRKERKGILGAYKFVNFMLTKSDITWVPLSIGEVIRVAGNIGLKISDSDFSRQVQGYKSGAISDDVLFVGFKDNNIYLLPLEVKTGFRPDFKKAVSQSKELKRYLYEDILGGNGLSNHLYRGLFIRQILMQIDKYNLYDVYEKDYFDSIVERKEYWLQGDYEVANINQYPDGMVLAHIENDSCFEPSFLEEDNILKIELPLSLLDNLVNTPLKSLMTNRPSDAFNFIPAEYILTNTKVDKTIVSSKLAAHVNTEEKPVHVEEAVFDVKSFESKELIPDVNINNDQSSLKILIGNEVLNKKDVYWEPTNTAIYMNPNAGIIGTMGTGKTQCTKSLITQLYRNQHKNVDSSPIGVLIFDYKSDYVDDDFCNATNAKKFKLHKLPYNPLSLYGDTPVLPVHTARGFAETMAKAFGLGQKQQLRLRKLIGEAYELAGINKSDSSTWKKHAPTIRDVWNLFIEQEKVEEDSLYAALESLYDMEIFEDNAEEVTSLYDLVDGVTVIELAGYPREIQNLIVALTLDLFYSQMQKRGKPKVLGDFRQLTKLILVDEADNFMSQNFPSLRKVLKEGREYGVGVVLSTQDITHFKTSDNDYSSYILSWVIHRVSQIKNQDIKALFNIDDKNKQEHLMKSIRELEKHHSLYVDGDKNLIKIKDRAFWELLESQSDS